MGRKYQELCTNCENWAQDSCTECLVPVCEDCWDDHCYEHEEEKEEEDSDGC